MLNESLVQVQVPGYHIIQDLGQGFVFQQFQGSFGVVYLADSNNKFGVPVAIKCIKKHRVSRIEDVEGVYKETSILTGLNHKHVIRLLEILDEPGQVVFVMEYAGGGDIQQLFRKIHYLTEFESLFIIRQIAKGVEYCHSKKTFHRDLKPENCLLNTKQTQVKIVDFGLADTVGHVGEKLKINCGTPLYICPEQVISESLRKMSKADSNELQVFTSYNGASADIWSIGIMLFQMSCGFLPFSGKNIAEKILLADLIIPDYVPPPIAEIIQKLLHKNPGLRLNLQDLLESKWFRSFSSKKKSFLENEVKLFAREGSEILSKAKIEDAKSKQCQAADAIVQDKSLKECIIAYGEAHLPNFGKSILSLEIPSETEAVAKSPKSREPKGFMSSKASRPMKSPSRRKISNGSFPIESIRTIKKTGNFVDHAQKKPPLKRRVSKYGNVSKLRMTFEKE